MRPAMVLGLAMLVFSCASGSPAKQLPPEDALLSALRTIDPEIRNAAIFLRIDVGNSDLLLAEGTVRSELEKSGSGEFLWWSSDLLAVLLQERANGKLEILNSVRQEHKDCCAVRVLRATADEIVLSQVGEKSTVEPNLKFFIDLRARTVRRVEYRPFSIQQVQLQGGVPYFIAGDRKQFLVIRADSRAPFLELVSGPASASIISALNVGLETSGAEEIRKIEERPQEIRFGASHQFRWNPSGAGGIFESTQNGDKEFPMPQSTYTDFVRARPAAAANISPPEAATIKEAIGPSQVVGSRLWFGKTFYDGEGDVGVGGIGYFDAATRSFTMTPIPEMNDTSATALMIENEVMWVGLASHGEWASAPGGLLRIDLTSMRTQRYMLPAVISSIVRYEDRLYLATSDGVAILPYDGKPEQYFIDLSHDGSFQLRK